MSNFNFRKSAQESTQLCSLMAGREKLDTSEVIAQDSLTIIAFDFAPKFDKSGSPVIDAETGEADMFGVVVFKEFPENYYSVGTVFTKVCKTWVKAFNGDAEEASAALAEEGGVKVKFFETKTKKGNNLVSVTVL